MAVSPSSRGKVAEALLRKHLQSLCVSTDMAWHRLPDAHSGSLQATLADFFFINKGSFFLLECKEVAHTYRLPHGNFDPAQVARMRLFKLAGAGALVLVYSSTTKLWRGYDIDRFIERTGGSWDLRDQEPTTLQELLK
jgi:hypothetical protein